MRLRLSLLALLLVLAAGCTAGRPAPGDEPTTDAPAASAAPATSAAPADSTTDGRPPETSPTPLILVSFDGFRWDYPRLYPTPGLDRMARQGTRAEYLTLAFPTKTFPNHYTIVTGLYPAHHGIISNNMYDPAYDASFSLGNQEAVRNARWWGGEPLWVTAETQDLTAATYFWPGSEAAIGGVRPTYWKPYDGRVPGNQRVDQVLDWLDLPAPKRPDFITLYFSKVDGAGHRYGPASKEVGQAVEAVDQSLGRLLDGLEARGLSDAVNVIVTSDHGMAARSPERVIFLDDYVDPDDLRVIEYSPVLMARPDSGNAETVYQALKGAHPKLDVYRKSEVPERLHFSGHRRIPEIIGIAAEGWSITTRGYYEDHPERFEGGTHGYEPSVRSMRGILYAQGPAFPSGARTGPIEAVDLYAMMCRLLGLDPAPNDGDAEASQSLLRKSATRQ